MLTTLTLRVSAGYLAAGGATGETSASFVPLLVLTVMACGGGGGCGGCACLEPLEGGFPVDELANSAGQVRLTGAGLDFIESNINPILGSFVGMTCPDG